VEFMFELIVVVAAFIVGIYAGKFISPGSRRVKELEKKLEEDNQQHQLYKDEVAQHFSQSANLFGDITEKYRSLYEHMSSGAQDLCDRRNIPQDLATSHVNILAAETPELSPMLTDDGVPIPSENEENISIQAAEQNDEKVPSSDELIVDVTRPGLSPLDQENHSIAMQNRDEADDNSAEVIDLDSQRREDTPKSQQAKDYAIKAKGVINHNSLNRDDVKT